MWWAAEYKRKSWNILSTSSASQQLIGYDKYWIFVLICFIFCFQLIKTSSYWSKNTLNNKSSWKKNQNKYSTFKLRQNQIYCWDTKDIYCFNAEIPTRLHKWFEPIVKAWSKHPLNRAETKSSSYLLLVIAVIF